MWAKTNQGLLVTFSGLDGAGKSTQIQRVMDIIRSTGREPVYLWTRGGYTPLFLTIKAILRRLANGSGLPPSGKNEHREKAFSNPLVRKLWLSLALFDLILVYGVQIRIWLLLGKYVICDRYLWDTLIDFQLNFPTEMVQNLPLWKLLAFVTPEPDAAFILVIPVEESQRRSKLKDEPYPDSAKTLEERLKRYLALGQKPGIKILDGQRPIEDLSEDIIGSVFNAIHTESMKAA